VQRNVPFSVMSSTRDHCSSVMSSTEAVPPSPALLIITSIRPKCPAAPSISAVGRLDADGYPTITGRLKDMYIWGGFNVYPAEVEQVLARLDGVAEAAVVGTPDPRRGEVGTAYVVTRPGHALAEADVLAFYRERLANY
jgi:acyl-CoA synthetase (AMP-forming)/AMP-acid ligase II